MKAGYSAATVSICFTHGTRLYDFLSDRITNSLLVQNLRVIVSKYHWLFYLSISLAICLSENPNCLANRRVSLVSSEAYNINNCKCDEKSVKYL